MFRHRYQNPTRLRKWDKLLDYIATQGKFFNFYAKIPSRLRKVGYTTRLQVQRDMSDSADRGDEQIVWRKSIKLDALETITPTEATILRGYLGFLGPPSSAKMVQLKKDQCGVNLTITRILAGLNPRQGFDGWSDEPSNLTGCQSGQASSKES